MADKTLDSELFVLYSCRFGAPTHKAEDTKGGILGSEHHNVATPFYPIGSVASYYNEGTGDGGAGQPGWSEFVYLQMVNDEASDPPTSAAKQICVPDSATLWYQFTCDPDDCIGGTNGTGMVGVVSISLVTDQYYGWFWSGGVCPEGAVSGLSGNYATESFVDQATAIGASNLTANAVGLGVYVTLTHAIGWTIADDSA